MKIAVIPDIHQAPNLDQVEQAVTRENPDLTIFLGDYFDQFGDTPADAGRTAEWLQHSLHEPKRIHLLGNHDLSYWFPGSPVVQCQGYTKEKYQAIKAHISESDWEKCRLYHWHNRWLFSHAGWSSHWFQSCTVSPRRFLKAEEAKAWKSFQAGQSHWIFYVGMRRGGVHPAGGLLWCDFHEFKPIAGINQVFGHTPGTAGGYVEGPKSRNWCLDTTDRFGMHHYLLINHDRVSVHGIDGARFFTRNEQEAAFQRVRQRSLGVEDELRQEEGGGLTAAEFAARLGVGIGEVRRYHKRGLIFAWKAKTGSPCYPAWQVHRGKLLSGLGEILAILRQDRLGALAIAIYFLSASRELNGKRPLDLLRAGQIEKIKSDARHYGHMGA